MFIYEKNKINSETGETEQTLNITFEGNKPVENPDVVVTKDGITGIKSDSNAYIATLPNGTDVSSYSIDGEIISKNIEDDFRSIALPFKKSIGINLTNTITTYLYYIEIYNGIYRYSELRDTQDNSIYLDTIGEYIFDIENKVLHTPSKDYNFTELSTYFNESINNKTFIGIAFNYSI